MSRNTGAFREGPAGHNTRSGNGLFEGVGTGPQGLIDYVTYFNDFTHRTDFLEVFTDESPSYWTVTQVDAGGAAAIDITVGGAGIVGHGHLVLDCPAAQDGPIVQLDSGVGAGLATFGVTPAAAVAGTSYASHVVFACKLRALDVTNTGFFVGLAELNATSTVRTLPEGAVTSDTHCGFYQARTDVGVWDFGVAGDDDTAAVTTAVPNVLTDGEWIEVGFVMDGAASATGYYRTLGDRNWTLIGTLEPDAAWDAQMLITFAAQGEAAGDDLWIDYVYCSQRRPLVI